MDYRFLSNVKVYFRDIDMMGHVNNAVYLNYLEVARMDLFDTVFGADGFERFPYVLADVHAKYLSSAHIRDVLEIGIRIPHIGRKSFKLEYCIRDAATKRVMCEADTVQVMFRYREEQSYDVPDEFRRALEAFQEGQES